MIKKLLILSLFCFATPLFGQETINTMFYNLLQFPEEQQSFNRAEILRDILNIYDPDVFMVCELNSAQGAETILDISLNDEGSDFTALPFVFNQSGSGDLQQLLFYRSNMFTLEDSGIITTSVRDINRYVLRLNTVNGDTNPILLHFYVTHLKSSQGGANVNLRLDMVNEFVATLGNLDPDSYVFFAGDLNFYTSTEPGYIELLDETNPIVLVDPIDRPGAWNSNINFQDVHTQSTRTSSGPFGAGAGGGMDDRFDFILISENMMSDPSMKYIPGTYKAYGNNGNCYNESVNDPACFGEFDTTLREMLYVMSDHLPVVMELETDQEIEILSGTEFDVSSEKIELIQNSVDSYIQLKFPTTMKKKLTVSVINTLGQVLHEQVMDTTYPEPIDVGSLAGGLYFIQVESVQVPLKFIRN